MKASNLLTIQFYFRQIVKVLSWVTVALCKLTVRMRDMFNNEATGILEDRLHAITMHEVRNVGTENTAGGGQPLCFYVNGSVTAFRAQTFYSKEPETLEWLDSIEENCVLWDIGANVGLYSVYAAARRQATVYAFEPSVFNLELLAKNIHLNGLSNKVHIVPTALTNKTGFAQFRMGDTHYGGALSAFGVSNGFDGEDMLTVFEYSLLGLSGDDMVRHGLTPLPQYIKIDVDGIEHLILEGMKEVLQSGTVRSVIVEGNDSFAEQVSRISRIMRGSGYELVAKKHAPMFDASDKFSGIYNQVWEPSQSHE